MLKQKVTETTVLVLPDFSKLFVVETDASAVAVAAVLSQEGHPLAYFSKKMCNRMQCSYVYVREMYAITEAVKKWRQYLIGRHFHIFTDQRSQKIYVTNNANTRATKWASKLQGFCFQIFYKPGKANPVADALSRRHTTEDSVLLSLSSPVPTLLERLRRYYSTDAEGQQMVSKYQNDPLLQQDYKFSDGLLLYKERVFLPDKMELRQSII